MHIVFIDDKFGFVSFKVIKLASSKSGNLSDLYRPVVVLAPVTKKKSEFPVYLSSVQPPARCDLLHIHFF